MNLQYFFISLIFVPFHNASANERNKRYIWLNREREHLLGLLWGIPFQTFLPGLVGRRKRSFQESDDEAFSKEFQGEFMDYTVQDEYEEEVANLRTIFSYLEINSLVCQERMICLLSSDPERFSPLSDVILREVRQNRGLIDKVVTSLIWRYVVAAKVGMISTTEECGQIYADCIIGPENIFNTPFMKTWQYVSKKLQMEFI